MNYKIPVAIFVVALGLSACDRPASTTVVVPTAVPGPAGPQGMTGDQGSKGATGYTGAQGQSGDTGAQGDPGQTGDTGRPGEKGKKGDGNSTVIVVPPASQ